MRSSSAVSCFLSYLGLIMKLILTGWPGACTLLIKVVVKSLRRARNEGGDAHRSERSPIVSSFHLLMITNSESRKRVLRATLRFKSHDHCSCILLGPFRGKFQQEQKKCPLSLTSEVFVLTFSPHLLFPPVAAGQGAQFYLETLSKSGDATGNTHTNQIRTVLSAFEDGNNETPRLHSRPERRMSSK